MKTKTNYPETAKRAKVLLTAALILIQVSLLAGKGSDGTKEIGKTTDYHAKCAKIPNALHAENSYYAHNEVAFESEYEIEDWMCNIHNAFDQNQADEEEIDLEEWMYNTQHIFWKDLSDAEEPELAIETWMANPREWITTKNELLLTAK